MKTTINIVIFVIMTNLMFGQGSNNTIQYLMGCDHIPGYEIRVGCDTVNFDPNEHEAPVLTYYVINKDYYLGGNLISENGDTTKIKDIYIKSHNKIIVFEVIGTDFNRNLITSSESYMLHKDKNSAKFYTPTFGIWTITRNNTY